MCGHKGMKDVTAQIGPQLWLLRDGRMQGCTDKMIE